MFRSLEAHVDRFVESLIRGRRLPRTPLESVDPDLIKVAATLAAGRVVDPRMSPALRRRLADRLGEQAARESGESSVTRRTAIGAAAGVLAGALGAVAFEGLHSAGRPLHLALDSPLGNPSGPAGGIMKPGGGRWIQVARLADLSELRPARVVAGDLVAYLFRSGDGVRAVSALCSHLPCALNWEPDGALLNCPCHNVNFTPAGSPVEAGYEVPALPSFEVRVTGGVVEILSA